MTVDGSCRRHGRAHEMSTAAVALTSLEIAVRGGSTTFARLETIGIHRETHRASRLAPFEPGLLEYPVQAFLFSLAFHQSRSRNDQSLLDGARELTAFDHFGGGAQIFDAGIGA